MKSKQVIYALALVAALITIGSALRLGSSWKEQRVSAESRREAAIQGLTLQNEALQAVIGLQKSAPDETYQLPADKALANAVIKLEASALSNGVKHYSVSVSGAAVSQHGSVIATLFQPLPHTNNRIATATLKIKGKYMDYAGLKKYLHDTVEMPSSIRQISIQDRSFELDLRIYAVR